MKKLFLSLLSSFVAAFFVEVPPMSPPILSSPLFHHFLGTKDFLRVSDKKKILPLHLFVPSASNSFMPLPSSSILLLPPPSLISLSLMHGINSIARRENFFRHFFFSFFSSSLCYLSFLSSFPLLSLFFHLSRN